MPTTKMVALIPARAGSKRVPGKNTRMLGGIPLLAWTIQAARDSALFTSIVVCSDDQTALGVADGFNVSSVERLPVTDDQPDVMWVRNALKVLPISPEQFAILRPTSPFRTADTIGRAYAQFQRTPDVHSLRAVEPVKQHPGKMWWCNGPGYPLTPVCDAKRSDGTPWHSSPTQTLPPCYVQNSSLEMAWTYVVHNLNTISGTKILPFFTEGHEGFTIDYESDWAEAERLVATGAVGRRSIPPPALDAADPGWAVPI